MPVSHRHAAPGSHVPRPGRRRRVLYCTNRYRTYERRNYEVLAEAFDLRVVWISPPPETESIPRALHERMQWSIVSDDPKRIESRDLVRSAKLFGIAVREGRGCAIIVAPAAGSWKTRVLFAASRVLDIPIAVRSDIWREGDGLLRGKSARKPGGVAAWMQQRITGHLQRTAAGVLVNGKKAGEYLLDRGIVQSRILPFRRLHSDLREQPLDTDLVDRLRRLKGDRVAFLYLGRIMHQKGLVPLIRAFRAVLATGRDAVLFVVGAPITKDTGRGLVSEDYYAEALRVAEGEPRIMFEGHAAPTTVHNYYAAADVFVHPHIAMVNGQHVHEPWGNVLTEAACMSMALIATDRVQASFDIVEAGVNGYLIEGDRVEDDLFAALVSFIEKPDLVSRFGRAARRRYELFADPQVNIDSLNQLIDRTHGV